MAQRPIHVPKFGNWDPNDHMPYTVVFDSARAGKGAKIINPNDPTENNALFVEGSGVGNVNQGISNEAVTEPIAQHQRRASRDDSEFGLGMESGSQGSNVRHGQRSSRGEEDSFSHLENGSSHRSSGDRASTGSGISPMHPQAYAGRLGRRPGSASPAVDKKPEAGVPGTPSRNRPERYAAPLPKFGDWDVNNPASGEGFTVIFNKARDEKKMGGAIRIPDSPLRSEPDVQKTQPANQESSSWFCRCFHPSAV